MISIILPVYNVEKYLHVCINSILKQSYNDFEIICIDDYSTDSSVEILEYFAQKDSRIKIIKNKKNIGPGPSRNKGLNIAKGKYILFLDSDDWFSLNTFETLINEFKKNNLDVLMFKNIVYYEKDKSFGMEKYYDMESLKKLNGKIFNHKDLDKTKFFKIPLGVVNKLYLKSFLDENNIRFPKENYIHEDNPFSCKVILTAEKISFIDKYFYNRRRRPGSIMTLNNYRLFDNIAIVYLILDVFLENKQNYEYYKEVILTYIFRSVLYEKYNQIENHYKEEFYKQVQDVFRNFVKEYKLYDDIKENVDKNILNFFKFEEIIAELLKNL